MTVKSLLLLMLGGIIVNNYALQKFLGVSPFLGYSKKQSGALGMGIAVTVVLVLSSAITWPVQTFVLDKLNAGYLQTLVFVAIILAVVYICEAVYKKCSKNSLGVYFPVIALNSAVLGAAINNISDGLNFVEALFASLGVGLGFLLGLLLLHGVQTRINEQHVPKAFRGLPIYLLAASILSMALLAFK